MEVESVGVRNKHFTKESWGLLSPTSSVIILQRQMVLESQIAPDCSSYFPTSLERAEWAIPLFCRIEFEKRIVIQCVIKYVIRVFLFRFQVAPYAYMSRQ